MSGDNYRWVMVGVLWLIHVIGFLNLSSLGILAPFFKEELRLTSLEIGLLTSAISVGACLMQVPAGLISDRLPVRPILALGVGVGGCVFLLLSYASSALYAFVALLVYGLCSGTMTPATSKSVLGWFPIAGRATAMGIKQTGVNVGGILAGILLPFLVLLFSWRRSILMVALAEIALAGFIFKLTREAPAPAQANSASMHWKKIPQLVMHRDMLLLGCAGFCFMAIQYCFSAYLTLFLTKEMNFSITKAGTYFALAYLIGGVGRILWSLLSDYLLGGRRKGVLLLITAIMFLSLALLTTISFLPAAAPLLLVAVLSFGAGGIGWNAIYLTILGEVLGHERAGLATGVGYFFAFAGSLFSPPLFGYLVDATGSYGFAWLFLTICAAANLVMLHQFQEGKARERSISGQEAGRPLN